MEVSEAQTDIFVDNPPKRRRGFNAISFQSGSRHITFLTMVTHSFLWPFFGRKSIGKHCKFRGETNLQEGSKGTKNEGGFCQPCTDLCKSLRDLKTRIECNRSPIASESSCNTLNYLELETTKKQSKFNMKNKNRQGTLGKKCECLQHAKK